MRRVRQAFTSKLRAAEGSGTRHDGFVFQDDQGVLLGKTRVSRGHASVSMQNMGLMAGELGIRLSELRGAIDCRLSREEFLERLRTSSTP